MPSKKNDKRISGQEFTEEVAPSSQLVHLRKRVAELETAIESARDARGVFHEAIDQIVRAVPARKPSPIIYQPDPKLGGSEVAFVPHITDWHIGAYTQPAHIEEFGEFSWARAKARVHDYTRKLIDKVAVARTGYQVPDCHVIGTADWISGDIHEELSRTNEFPCPVQAVNAGFLLGEFVEALSPHFRMVYVHALNAGNHDRITKKPQFEQGGLNSYGYVVTAIAKQYLSRMGNVDFQSYVGSSFIANVIGTRYLGMHGDGIPAHMGVPHFGMDRLVMREALRRMNCPDEKHFDAVVCGHWHVANNLWFCRYGGSLSGTTAHDHKFARSARPHQTSWFVHPRHGEFDWTRWML